MTQYIGKNKIKEEIERLIDSNKSLKTLDPTYYEGLVDSLDDVLSFINTLEVKDANEALRTEYEKGRADVIADTLSWLANCWPKYCSNQTIIDGFKEVIKD